MRVRTKHDQQVTFSGRLTEYLGIPDKKKRDNLLGEKRKRVSEEVARAAARFSIACQSARERSGAKKILVSTGENGTQVYADLETTDAFDTWFKKQVEVTRTKKLAQLKDIGVDLGEYSDLIENSTVDKGVFDARTEQEAWNDWRGRVFEWLVYGLLLTLSKHGFHCGKSLVIESGVCVPLAVPEGEAPMWFAYQVRIVDKTLGIPHDADFVLGRTPSIAKGHDIECLLECKSHKQYQSNIVKDTFLRGLGARALSVLLVTDGKVGTKTVRDGVHNGRIVLVQVVWPGEGVKAMSAPRKTGESPITFEHAMESAIAARRFKKHYDDMLGDARRKERARGGA